MMTHTMVPKAKQRKRLVSVHADRMSERGRLRTVTRIGGSGGRVKKRSPVVPTELKQGWEDSL